MWTSVGGQPGRGRSGADSRRDQGKTIQKPSAGANDMRRKLLLMTVGTIAATLFSMGILAQAGAQGNPAGSSASNADKINMVKKACANGALTKEECAAKIAALQGGPSARGNTSPRNNNLAPGNSWTAGG